MSITINQNPKSRMSNRKALHQRIKWSRVICLMIKTYSRVSIRITKSSIWLLIRCH